MPGQPDQSMGKNNDKIKKILSPEKELVLTREMQCRGRAAKGLERKWNQH